MLEYLIYFKSQFSKNKRKRKRNVRLEIINQEDQ